MAIGLAEFGLASLVSLLNAGGAWFAVRKGVANAYDKMRAEEKAKVDTLAESIDLAKRNAAELIGAQELVKTEFASSLWQEHRRLELKWQVLADLLNAVNQIHNIHGRYLSAHNAGLITDVVDSPEILTAELNSAYSRGCLVLEGDFLDDAFATYFQQCYTASVATAKVDEHRLRLEACSHLRRLIIAKGKDELKFAKSMSVSTSSSRMHATN